MFSMVFDEASNTFALVDEETGRTGKAAPAGAEGNLETPQVTLYLRDSRVEGSGPAGPSVTLHLVLGLKPQTKGKTLVVEVAATDDLGNEDTFTPAGSLIVTP